MKNILTFLIAEIFTFISCEKTDINIDAPMCIKDKIEVIMAAKVNNPPTQIWKWEADGEIYYYITSNCCDQYNNLFNGKCELVCAPDGGITGNGDGNCPIFTHKIVKIFIWEDKRN